MFAMLVTEAVLNSGTDCNDLQPWNMLVIVVTEDVLNNGTDCNEIQS